MRRLLTPITGMVVLAVVSGGLLGYWLRWLTAPPTVAVLRAAPTATPRPSPGLAATDYPVTIPAQRARHYTASSIHLEQDLGDRGGYRLSRVSYTSDGDRVYGLMATPTSARPTFGYPVVIVVHGYHQGDTYQTVSNDYAPEMQALATHGYIAIKPDLSGHGQSWGIAESAYFSPDYTADVLNLTASLATYRPANAQAVGLFGHSMGGYVVMDALAAQPQRFKAAVLLNGAVGDLNDMYYNWQAPSEQGVPVSLLEKQRLVKLFGDPKQNPDFWRTISPLTYAAEITTAVQINEGQADGVVPVRFSAQLQQALAAGRAVVQYNLYPGAGHVFSGASQAQLLERMVPFYDQYMGL